MKKLSRWVRENHPAVIDILWFLLMAAGVSVFTRVATEILLRYLGIL